MVIYVTKVENNMDHIQNKDSAIFTQTEDGMTIVQNNIYRLCDRIWLREEFSLNIGWNYKYEITPNDGVTLEG